MESVSRELVDLAIQNDTDDNASVVGIHVNKMIPASSIDEHQAGKKNNWFENLRKTTL